MVLDDKYKELYTAEYQAWDAAFDNYGYLLVGDDAKKCVQVLNAATGEHVQTISSDLIRGVLIYLVMQDNDELAVGIRFYDKHNAYYKGELLSIKYLQ